MRAMAHVMAQSLALLALCAAAISCRQAEASAALAASGASGAAASSGEAGRASRTAGDRGGIASPITGRSGSGGGAGNAAQRSTGLLASSAGAGGAPICKASDQLVGFYLEGKDSGSGTNSYEGWATVESSDATQLVLQQLAQTELAEDAGVDVEARSAPYTIRALVGALPLVTVGKRVWLVQFADPTKTPSAANPKPLSNGSSFSVSTRQAGVLIAGAASVPLESAVLGKLSIGSPQLICSRPGALCFPEGSVLSYSLEVTGGTPVVRIDESLQAETTADGITYEISVRSAHRPVRKGKPDCADPPPDSRMWIAVDVLPKDAGHTVFAID